MYDSNIDVFAHGTFSPKRMWQYGCITIDWVDENVESWNSEHYKNDQHQFNKLRNAFGVTEKELIRIVIDI
jgi:hypothetical protein